MCENILQKYKPIIYLHSSEKYFPSSIDYIIRNSFLVDDSIVIKNPSNKLIYDLSSIKYKNKTSLENFYLYIDPSKKGGQKDLHNVPIYGLCNKFKNYTELTYIMVYPFNPHYKVLGLFGVGEHYGDIEHITVRISHDNNIIKVLYGAHGKEDGRWVYKKDLPFENGRPVVYSALGSHGCYPRPFMAWRYFGLANDYMNKGIRWEPRVEMLYHDKDIKFKKETMGWMYMAGRIGYHGVTSVSDKYWFIRGEPEEYELNPPKIYTVEDVVFYIFLLFLLLRRIII